MNESRKSVSVIIPTHNEEATIGLVLDDLARVREQLAARYEFETIVVDDHCADRTAELARGKGARVVANPRLPGKGHALIAGFEAARGDYLVMMDGDYSHRAEDLPRFLELLEAGSGLVVGSRATGGSDEYTIVRTFGNVFLTSFFHLVIGIPITDALNGYKAFRREVFHGQRRHYTARHFEIEIELLINTLRAGYRFAEFPSHERARAGGVMKSSALRHGFSFFRKIAVEGLKYRLTRR